MGSDAAHEPVAAGGGSWVLPGTGSGRGAQLWTLAILAGLLASRLLLFPDGPWEQDEALFSTGVMSFDVPSHQPHPPGFPGWIFLGKLLLPLTNDSLVALRLWSSLSSVAIVWLLARLLARITLPSAALAGSLAFAFSPLFWAHSARAFSSPPALVLGLLALHLWVPGRSLTAARALAGWALLGFAVTIRPQLGPELSMLGLAGLWCLRSRPKLALLGVGLAAVVVVAVFGVAIADSGWDAYWASARQHFGVHFSGRAAPRKGAPGFLERIGEWGIVRTNGGLIGALLLVITTAYGLLCISAKSRKLAAWWLILAVIATVMLMAAHSPRVPRYQISLLLILVGPITVAFARFGRVGSAALAALGALGAVLAYPALRAMHEGPLPPVAALRAIASQQPRGILYSGGLFSFAKFLDFDGELPTHPTVPGKSRVAMPRDTFALGGREVRFLAGPNTCTWTFDDFPKEAWELSQKRFNRVLVAKNPVLLGPGVFNLESVGKGRRAAWLSDEATLYVPAPSDLLMLRLDVPKDHAPQRLLAFSKDTLLSDQELEAGKQTVAVPLAFCDDRCDIKLRLSDGWTASHDPRTLTSRLFDAWAIKADGVGAWKWQPESDLPAGIGLDGFYPAEQGNAANQGRWTRDHAVVSFQATSGTLVLGLRRPQYTSGIVRISTGESELLPDIRSEPSKIVVHVRGDSQKRVNVSLDSPSFTPAQVETGSSDTRSLALQVTEMAFYPDEKVACPASLVQPIP